MHNIYKCHNCSQSFEERQNSANKYCSRECYVQGRFGSRPWASCSCCLAAVGFGKEITGRILGVRPGTVLSQRKRDGIKTQTPSMGSWSLWAKRKAAGKNPDKKRKDYEVAYDKARMDDIKQACKRGFDWSYEWTKEVARRSANAKYHAMTPEEKAEKQKHSRRRIRARLKANPELKADRAEKARQWRDKNKDHIKQKSREWRKNNPDKIRGYHKKRMKNPVFRALNNQRDRFKDIMKSVKNGGTSSYSDKIGCTTEEFNSYIAAQFKPGMTWDNYGTYWHIDHIIPCAAFDHSDPHQVALCWHHSNMQPLEARENMLKSDKFDEEQLNLLINHTNQEA